MTNTINDDVCVSNPRGTVNVLHKKRIGSRVAWVPVA